MAKAWAEVANSPEYKALPPSEQEAARNEYFSDVVAPRVPEEERDAAKKEFLEDTAPKQIESRGFLAETGRQLGLAGRAVLEAPAQIAAMPGDAIASVYNLAKQKEPISASQFNPLSSKGWAAPSGPGMMKPAGQTIHEGLTAAGLPEPETTTERIASGVEGVLAGGKVPLGVGAKTAAAAKAASAAEKPSALSAIRSGLSPTSPQERGATMAQRKQTKDAIKALDKVEEAMKRDRTTLADASKDVKEAQKKGIPLTLSDTGPNATSMAAVLAQRPGAAQSIMHEGRLASLLDTKTRVPGQVREAMDAKGDQGLFEKGLKNVRTDKAKKNYEAVRQDATPVMDPEIWSVLENPIIARLYQEARSTHMDERSLRTSAGKTSPELADIYAPVKPSTPGKAIAPDAPVSPHLGQPEAARPETEWVRTGTAPDVKSLDYLIRAIDDKVSAQYANKGPGGAVSEKKAGSGGLASALKEVRDVLKRRLETVSPAYKQASSEYGLDSQIMDASEYGSKGIFEDTPGLVAQKIGKMNESEKNAARMGAVEKILSGIEKSGRNVNAAANVLGGPRQEAVLRQLFPGKDYDVFKKTMDLESKIHQNTGQITRNSETFRRAAAAEDFEETPASEKIGKAATVLSLLRHGWLGTAWHMVSGMMKSPTWNQGKAEMVSRILSSKDPEKVVERLQKLAENNPPTGLARRTATRTGKIASVGLRGDELARGSTTLRSMDDQSSRDNNSKLQDMRN